jgi:arylsulfatase A-like enzyme
LGAPAFDRLGSETTNRAISWLEAHDVARPFFLWVHYYDPHEPYAPPPGYARRFRRAPGAKPGLERLLARYDGEIAFTDEQVERLLQVQDRRFGPTRTLIVVASDHGEGFMQHGWMGHGVNLYEELVRAILIMRWPGHVPSGVRVAIPVSLADLVPTVLSLLGRTAEPGAFDGADLSATHTQAEGAERPIFLVRRSYEETLPNGALAGAMSGVRAGRWKYIEAPEEGGASLFDLVNDPGETTNRVSEEPEQVARLAALLGAWRAGRADAHGTVAGVRPDRARVLESLGYVE